MLLQTSYGVPVGDIAIHLRGGPAMECDPRHTSVCSCEPGVEVRQVIVINSLSHLHTDGDSIICSLDCTMNDRRKKITLPWQCTSAALAGDLGHRASEIQINVVSTIFVDDDAYGLCRDYWINSI